MNKLLLSVLSIVVISGCHPHIEGSKCDTGSTDLAICIVPPINDTVQEEIDEIVAYKNEERALTAQAPLTNGLSCVVQEVASGSCLSASSVLVGCSAPAVLVMTGTAYTYLYKGSFDQPSVASSVADNLLPLALKGIFLNKNYRISCTGYIVVLDSDYYDFTLNSDDASILTINGGQVVNNDNNHGMTLKLGSALLYRNVQSFSLQYAQAGGGNHGLILQAGSATIDPKYYFH